MLHKKQIKILIKLFALFFLFAIMYMLAKYNTKESFNKHNEFSIS